MVKKTTTPIPSALEEQQLKNAIVEGFLKEEQIKTELYNRRKARWEGHWIKMWLIPGLTIFGLLGSAYFVFFTDKLQTKEDKNTATKAKNDAEIILATAKLEKDNKFSIMQQTELIINKAKLERDTAALNDKKKGLKFENIRLNGSNDYLQGTLKRTNEELKLKRFDIDRLNKDLQQSSFNAAYWEEEKGFSTYEYHLKLLKEDALENKSFSADFLANGIKNDKKYSKRITDNLVVLPTSKTNYLYGIANYIMYLGTNDKYYVNSISNLIRNNITSSFTAIDYRMFRSQKWQGDDIRKIILAYSEALSINLNRKDAYFLLNALADIQDNNAHLQYNLYNLDFDLFIKYINICRELYNSEDEINKNISETKNNKINILRCLLITCPQIFVARSVLETNIQLKRIKPLLTKRISMNDTTKAEGLKTLTSMAEQMNYSAITRANLSYINSMVSDKVRNTLNPKNLKDKKLSIIEVGEESLKYLKIYNDLFENKGNVDLNEIRSRLKRDML